MRAVAVWLPLSILIVATPAATLERQALPFTDAREHGDWSSGASCSVSYFNSCTGWIWVWSGWSPTDRVGMTIDTCCPPGVFEYLTTTNLYAWNGAPSGYGFTGTISIHVADDNGCPTSALESRPLLPASGDNQSAWFISTTGRSVVVVYEHADAALPDPIAWVSDHPAAGPTGPTACGTCFPTTRVARSFHFGKATSPLCPGSPPNDGICDAQWYWSASVFCSENICTVTVFA